MSTFVSKSAAFVVAACLAVASFIAPAPASAWDLDALNKTINQTNFIVDQGCSGTLISLEEKLILTNHHCIDRKLSMVEREEQQPDGTIKKVKREKREDVTVEQRSYQGHTQVGAASYETEIVAHMKSRDIALLRIKADAIPHTIFSPVLPLGKTVTRGETVYIVGNPALLDASVGKGIISSTTRSEEFRWLDGEKVAFLQFDAGVWFGNSGGALYNEQGFLIGVPAVIVGSSHLGLALSPEVIREVLAKNCYARVYGADKAADEKCRTAKTDKAKKVEDNK